MQGEGEGAVPVRLAARRLACEVCFLLRSWCVGELSKDRDLFPRRDSRLFFLAAFSLSLSLSLSLSSSMTAPPNFSSLTPLWLWLWGGNGSDPRALSALLASILENGLPKVFRVSAVGDFPLERNLREWRMFLGIAQNSWACE